MKTYQYFSSQQNSQEFQIFQNFNKSEKVYDLFIYMKQTNIIYVMISKGLRKRPATSSLQPNNAKKKSKSKSKSKQKSKKFNAKDFLQALIDLQNTNCSTNKKKRNTTRDISSALTVATPILEKTISASKIRSKSSFSQYRKKINGTSKQPMTINLCAIITQEDNVQYTEKTARSSQQENENQKNGMNTIKDNTAVKVNYNACALRIQRAWRNYQTYKMVHQVYIREKRQKQMKSRKRNNGNFVHIKIKKPDMEKTLKIKNEHAIRKRQRIQQQFYQTQKIIKQRYGQSKGEISSRQHNSPIEQFSTNSYQSGHASHIDQSQILQKLKERQAYMLKQVIEMIEKEEKEGNAETKQQLINKLIDKCEKNKKILEKDFNGQLLALKRDQEEVPLQRDDEEQSEIKNMKRVDSKSALSIRSQKSSLNESFDHQNLGEEIEEIKIFEQRLKYIKQQKIRKLQLIDDDVLESRITNSQAIRKKQKLHSQFEKQRKQLNKNKNKFLFSLAKLKKCAIKCQKFALQQTSSYKKIRKSFSSGNTVIKQVLEDIKLLDILEKEQEGEDDICKWLFKREAEVRPSDNIKALTTTPIIELPSPNKTSQAEEQLLSKNTNTEVMKQYSQEIQQMIEKDLIEEFVASIFVEEGLFEYFKPYVEEIFEFKKITDKQICGFTDTISNYLPGIQIMIKRVNQKINPTSLQILRIIRDVDYQTDEYQLIIPEQCFKKYRANIEKIFEQTNPFKQIDFSELSGKIKNMEVAEKVYRMELQKREKMKKYRNFERDLQIMYMKSVFNCVNEFLIELKSSNAFMNARSSIGPGQLTLALKEYNQIYGKQDYLNLLDQVKSRVGALVNNKCSIPSFKNYHDIELFQKQVMKQIQIDSNESEFKWVNYMDEVLEIWQDLSSSIIEQIFSEACVDIKFFFQ